MICWSCERAAGDRATCRHCEAIQPPDAGSDWFAVLGLPRRYGLDVAAAEDNFRQLSRQFHPDRFAKADPRARRASLQRTVQLNEAWRTIKNPVRRAEYLLQTWGYDLGSDESSSRPTSATSGKEPARPARPVPAVLLGEILELREELAEARARGDDLRVQRMAADVRDRVRAALDRVADAFARLEGAGDESARDSELGQAARDLIAIRYFQRFLDEVSVHDEAIAGGSEGASHA